MIKKVAIISLSRGTLGEPFISHELEIGLNRLKNYGLEVVTTESALKGIEYIKNNPQERAKDLINALKDKSIDMVLCAIGGDDTYRLLPYLFENDELKNAVKDNKKIFLGYSDTTWNHFMFNKVGFKTFYGQAFITDLCELENEMLPYSRKYFKELINKESINKIEPSDVWYSERTNFDASQIGTHIRPQSVNRLIKKNNTKPSFFFKAVYCENDYSFRCKIKSKACIAIQKKIPGKAS